MAKKNNEMLVNLVVNNKGYWNGVYQDLLSKKEYGDTAPVKDSFITILDEEYPDGLKQVYHPPFALFYKGNLSLLNNKDIIALGIDSMWDYSWEKLDELLDFNGNFHYIIGGSKPIIKGLARSLKNLIVVVDKGFNLVDNELIDLVVNNGGLVLTEFPHNVGEDTNDFTRIVSALENKLLVVHCENRGYAIRQVNNSLYLGHTVYAMPTPLDSLKETKNNQLIAEGALLFYTKTQLAE